MSAYELEAGHPFVYRELVLARIVVEVLDEARRELSNAWRSFRARRIYHSLGEVWIEFVLFRVGYGSFIRGHFGGVMGWGRG